MSAKLEATNKSKRLNIKNNIQKDKGAAVNDLSWYPDKEIDLLNDTGIQYKTVSVASRANRQNYAQVEQNDSSEEHIRG